MSLVVVLAASCALAQEPINDSLPGLVYRYYDRPIDPDKYLIRPGETLTIHFIGTSLPAKAMTVNAEGLVVDPNMGVLDLANHTLARAREALKGPLEALYTAERIEVSIGKPIPVSISVTGAVEHPGRYIVYTSYSVGEVLELAGGILNTGSRRHIELLGGPQPLAVDLDRAVYLGDDNADPYVYAGYRINVPERSTNNVYVLGEVYHPREIELLSGDTPDELVAMAGGVTPRADTAATAILPDKVRPGDVIMIPSAGASGTGTVVAFGAVDSPGLYRLKPDMSLDSLIAVAGGLTGMANPARTTVFRMVPAEMRDLVDNRRYPVTVSSSESASFLLQADDSIYVPTTLGFVRVAGAVKNPGLVPYKAGKSVNQYVQDAGGFVPSADQKNIQLTDRVSRISSLVGPAAIVHDGDIVTVKRREESQ